MKIKNSNILTWRRRRLDLGPLAASWLTGEPGKPSRIHNKLPDHGEDSADFHNWSMLAAFAAAVVAVVVVVFVAAAAVVIFGR